MKAITKKTAAVAQKAVAQCCAKHSKIISGCHD